MIGSGSSEAIVTYSSANNSHRENPSSASTVFDDLNPGTILACGCFFVLSSVEFSTDKMNSTRLDR